MLSKSFFIFLAIVFLIWRNPTYIYSNFRTVIEVAKYENNLSPIVPRIFRQIKKQTLICEAIGQDPTYFLLSELHPPCLRDASYYWFNQYLILHGTPIPNYATSFCTQFIALIDSPKLAMMEQSLFNESAAYCLNTSEQNRVFKQLLESHKKFEGLWVRNDLEPIMKNLPE